MAEKPKVVVKARHTRSVIRDFKFTQADMPTLSDSTLASYRTQAWKAFKQLSLPKTTDEPWRRTDLRRMPVDTFSLPAEGAYKDLPEVPADLLKPLVADQHTGCGSTRWADPSYAWRRRS